MIRITTSKKNNVTKVAPSLPGHFILRNWRELQRNKFEFMLRASQAYGDIIWVNTPFESHYLISHPDYIQYILQNNRQNYSVQTAGYEVGQGYFGQPLFKQEGDSWLRQRRLIQSVFQHQNMTHLVSLMTNLINTMLIDWESVAENEALLNVDTQMKHLCLAIARETIFGLESNDKANVISQSFDTIIKKYFNLKNFPSLLLPWVFNRHDRELNAALKALDNFVYALIAERRASTSLPLGRKSKGDILSRFIVAQDAETGKTMTDQQVRDEILSSFFDASDTLPTTLTWTWYLLAQYPRMAEKLRAELSTVLGDRSPTVDDLPNLPYSRMVIQEALRLYPISSYIPRTSIQDDEIGGYHISANTEIAISVASVQRHRDFWENPNTFEPERFTPERVAKRHKFSYIPFGGGSRHCLGSHFAMMQAQMILVTIAQRFNLKLVSTHPVIPETPLNLRPKDGVFVRVEKI